MTAATQTLPAWLLDQIAEDEAKARDAGEGDLVARYANMAPDLIAAHIANWDPARVLAECEAKRRIVADCQRIDRVAGDDEWHMGYSDGNYDALKAIALPYADREGWREEWRP